MLIEVNDWVVHPECGICRVVRQEVQDFGPGQAQQYFVVAIAKGTMWVPVEDGQSRLRKLTAKRELEKYRNVLRGRPTPLISDSRQRQIALHGSLKGGSFQARCEAVRDLTAHSWNKPLGDAGGLLLRNVREALCAEWALAENLSVAEASQEVDALLLQGRQTYKT